MILPSAATLGAALHDYACAPKCGDESEAHHGVYLDQAVRLMASALCDPEGALDVLDRHAALVIEKSAAHVEQAKAAETPEERDQHFNAAGSLRARAAGVAEARTMLEPYFAIRDRFLP